MKGTLQGDFSRSPFNRRKRYSSVRMQQGRVQLDSDWNEQADILEQRIRAGTADLIGPAGAPVPGGFEVTPGRHGLELGPEQHFVQIGEPGFKGFLLPEGAGGEQGSTLEVQVLPRLSGQIVGCWTRREGEVKWKPVYSLHLDGGVLRLLRMNLSALSAEERWDLTDRLHHIALTWGPEGTSILLDGESVASDGIGFGVPSGRTLLIVGSNQKPFFAGTFCELRLWRESRTAAELAAHRDRRLDGDEPGLVGLWRFDEAEGGVIPDRSPSGNDAHVTGSGRPPRRLPADFHLGAGRYYVDGILCESPQATPLTAQPDLPGGGLSPAGTVPQPRGTEREHHVFYLDVWERSITAIEDPDIRETALGGADTATRGRVVAQVRSVPVTTAWSQSPSVPEIHEEWNRLIAPELERGRLQARRRPLAPQKLDNLLYRIEVHDGGDGRDVAVKPLGPGDGKVITLEQWDGGWRRGQAVEIFQDGAAPQDPPRHTARVTALDPGEQTLTLDSSPGTALRTKVELRIRRIATFKWSRNNASVVFPVHKLDTASGVVRLLPSPRGLQDLKEKDWVEVVDDHLALRQDAEPLCRVDRVDPLIHQIVLRPTPPPGVGTEPLRHPLVRLWDQRGEGLTAWGTVPATGGDWQEIEAGIQVRFAYDAPYHTGDYWWITARTLSQDQEIDWPRDGQGTPRVLPPHGVERRLSPLALLTYDPDGYHLLDLRRVFQPLSEGAVSKAGDSMHGDLDIRANLRVSGDLEVQGRADLGAIYGTLHSRDAVHTAQIADRSVTPEKLSSSVGVVPAEHSILGPTAEAPEGYTYSRWAMTLNHEEPRWVDRRQMPGGPPGPLVSAALGNKVYILLESGVLWAYEPRSNGWQRRKDLPAAVRGCSLAVLAGKLHAVGGVDPTGRCSGRHFEYDPAADTWTERGALVTPRTAFGLVGCRDRLHALGGLRESATGKCATARHEAWDPMTGIWSPRQPLPSRVSALGAATVGDRIHIVGGELRSVQGRGRPSLTDEHHQYHPAADRWILNRAPLPVPRCSVRLVAVFGRLYAVGGEGGLGWLADFDAYDPATDGWLAYPPLHEPVDRPGVAALDGAVYVVGALRAGAALVEECEVALRLFLHRRGPDRSASAAAPAAPERPAAASPEDGTPWEELDLG